MSTIPPHDQHRIKLPSIASITLPSIASIMLPEKRRLTDDEPCDTSRHRKPTSSSSQRCLHCAEPRQAIRSFFEHRRRNEIWIREQMRVREHILLQEAQFAFMRDGLIPSQGSFQILDPVPPENLKFNTTSSTWIVLDAVRGFHQNRKTDCTFCQILLNSVLQEKEKFSILRFHGDGEEPLELRVGIFSTMFGLENDRKSRGSANDCFCILLGTKKTFQQDRDVLHESIQANGIAVFRQDENIKGLFAGHVLAEYFNATVIREAIAYCRKHHKLCIPTTTRVQGLELIDCNSRRIGPAREGSLYVALSYVWGSSHDQQAYNIQHVDGQKLLPVLLPRTISDAMMVTRQLGYQYLWVDKFCIDQNNGEEFHKQIRQMDAVYECAELTIIAAAGDDEDSHLPGVSAARASKQLIADLGGMSVIWVKDPQHDIRASKWATRGWTFQEGVLARRRLVFTQEQVYFECNAMNFFENVHTPLDELHNVSRTKFREEFRAGMFGRKRKFGKWNPNTMTSHQLFMQYCSCVEEYSNRTLRYDSDALNAFNGIIRRFSKNKIPMIDVLGLAYPHEGKSEVQLNTFVRSLLWLSVEGSSSRRRPEFPSWTWAGWDTVVQYHGHVDSRSLQFSNALLSISFEYHLSAEVVEFGGQHHRKDVPQILRVDAYTVPSYAFTFTCFQMVDENFDQVSQPWTVSKFKATLLFCQTTISSLEIIKELIEGHRYKGIYVGSTRNPPQVFIMILESQTLSTWSRAGVCIVDCDKNEFQAWLGRKRGSQWALNAKWASFRIL